MYKCGEKLASWTLLLLFTTLLTACGGANTDKPSNDTDNTPTANNNGASSSNIALVAKSSQAAQSSSAAISFSSQAITQEKDSTPPSTTQFLLKQLSENSVTLAWDSATDNTGISIYKIERNGQLIATLNYPTYIFTDTNLQSYAAYTYTITAVDLSGNSSRVSAPFTVRTLGNASSAASSNLIITGPATNPGSAATSSIFSSVNASAKTSSAISSAAISSNGVSSAKTTSSTISSSKASSSTAFSSKPASSTSSNSSATISSIAASNSSSSSAADKNTVERQKVIISWNHPNQRENGHFLELDEIGGYEIRFKRSLTSDYIYVPLPGNLVTSYITDLIPTNGIVEIAVYDINGIYSAFTTISAYTQKD